MTQSANTRIQPLTYDVNSSTGEASIGGLSVSELAQSFGTPLYVLDAVTLKSMIRSYKEAFSAYPQPVNVLFAGKANLNMGLCALLKQEGMGLDVVSGGEFYTALKAGFPVESIFFNGNNKSYDELTLAISNNVGRISVDNFYELGLIDEVARELGKKVPVILRITPGIECHTHDYIKTGSIDSKFGFNLPELSAAIELVTKQYADTIDLTGLHAHIGSQIFETQPYHDLVEVMLNLFYNIRQEYGLTLHTLNLGGGLGIAYQGSDDPVNVSDYAKVILDKVQSYAAQIDFPLPSLVLEPGRSLVATAGCTLYTVGSIKEIPQINKTYVAVDGGMGDNIRPALYGAVYSAIIANKAHEAHRKTVTIAGKFCESGDILIKEFAVPDSTTSGDHLLVFGTGAYNYSMSSNYNRVPRPAMVLVENGAGELLVSRETYDDLIAQDQIPSSILKPQHTTIG